MNIEQVGSKFAGGKFLLKRSLLKVLGSEFFITDPQGSFLFLAFRPIKLKDEITIFADEQKTIPVLRINARQSVLTDFAGTWDVFDVLTQQRICVLKRKALNSFVRDEWEVMDANEMPLAVLLEDSIAMALLRRFLTNLVPQNYDVICNGQRVVDLKQNFNPLTYHLNIEMIGPFDARIAVVLGVMLASIEGRQS